MRVLVTGGAGFIGSHLVRALARAGHHVRALDDLSTGSRERLAGLAVDLLPGDVRNPQAVRRAMEGCQVVFHLASARALLDGDRPLWRAEEINVGGALNVLDAARELGTRRVIIASNGDVYGRAAAMVLHEEVAPVPASPEGLQHLTVEHYARLYREAYRVPVVLLRVFPTFGPGERLDGPGLVPRLCRAALLGASPVIEGDPHQTRDLVYVENVVAAMVDAMTQPQIEGAIFNIASGEAVSVGSVWQALLELTGRPKMSIEPTYVPPTHWEQTNVRVAITRACRTLGYTVAVKLRDGLKLTLDSFRGQRLEMPEEEPNGWFTPRDEVPTVRPATQRLWPVADPPPPPMVSPAHLTPSVVAAVPGLALTPASVSAVRPVARPATTTGSVATTPPRPGTQTSTTTGSVATTPPPRPGTQTATRATTTGTQTATRTTGSNYSTVTRAGAAGAGASTAPPARRTPPTLPAVPSVMSSGRRPPPPPLAPLSVVHSTTAEEVELDADELVEDGDNAHAGAGANGGTR